MGFVYLPSSDGSINWGAVPAELVLTPTYHRANVRGGPAVAEVEVRGPKAALEETFGWLRRPIYLRNDNGLDVWSGFVNEVRVTIGATAYTVTLDAMANRIAIAYSEPTPDGGSQRLTTAWVEDTNSSARYGVREFLESMGTATTAQAQARQTQLLAKLAAVSGTPTPSNKPGSGMALLICVGWIETFGWRMYSRLDGRIEFEGAIGRTQAIGWSVLNDIRFGFGGGSIQDMAGRLAALAYGSQITVTGSASNNGTWTLSGTTSDEVQSAASNTIYFEESDDIFANLSILGFAKEGYWIKVSGSPANSRYHKVGATGDRHVRTSASVSGLIVNEGTGPVITIEQGQKAMLASGAGSTWEAPAASISVILTGHIMAQSFAVASTMKVAQVGVKVGKIGSPSDNFTVAIYSDSSGSPGTAVASGTLAPSSIVATPEWRWITIPTPTLTPGTYWIVVSRSGSVEGTNCFSVELSTTAYGTCKAWNSSGGGWIANPLGEYMPIKVWSSEDTADQMREIVGDTAQFGILGDIISATGVATNPYRDDDETALDALRKLIDTGMSDGGRLLVTMIDRVLYVYEEPAPSAALVLDMDGNLRQAAGGILPQGLLPIGQWLDVVGLSPATKAALSVSPVLLEEAEYDWRERTLQIKRVRTAVEGI